MFTGDDQLTLNPVLELFIYATSDRWPTCWRDEGSRRGALVRTKSWKRLAPRISRRAPELVQALSDAMAERWG